MCSGGACAAGQTCAGMGESCANANCCAGVCGSDGVCVCAADGEACIGGGDGACCSGQPCNDQGTCGAATCGGLGTGCTADAQCCDGGAGVRCCNLLDGTGAVCTDTSASGTCPATACAAGLALCGEVCADLQADPFNCGACGVACGDAATCQSGGCVAV